MIFFDIFIKNDDFLIFLSKIIKNQKKFDQKIGQFFDQKFDRKMIKKLIKHGSKNWSIF